MTDRKLYLETQAAERLREKLVATYGDDAELIKDMIEGETGLHEAISRAALELAAVEGEKEGINIAMAKLKERLTRYANRATAIREAIFSAMETAELRSLKTPAATLSIRASPPSAEITDPALLPPVYLKQPPPTPDKTAIRDALKAGEAIPGAPLSNQPDALSVRYS
jgi:hypothetical protein